MRRKFFSIARNDAATQRSTLQASRPRQTRRGAFARPTAGLRSSWGWPGSEAATVQCPSDGGGNILPAFPQTIRGRRRFLLPPNRPVCAAAPSRLSLPAWSWRAWRLSPALSVPRASAGLGSRLCDCGSAAPDAADPNLGGSPPATLSCENRSSASNYERDTLNKLQLYRWGWTINNYVSTV